MPMELIETRILGDSVQMRYADHADAASAAEPLANLTQPIVRHQVEPLGDPQAQFLGEVQLAALRYMRDVIGGETQGLSELIGRIRRGLLGAAPCVLRVSDSCDQRLIG
jgi:hypothetical protein